MRMQKRDENLMQYLSKYGVLSTDQIRKTLFQNTAQTTVLRRLRILEGEGLILRNDGLLSGGCAWGLSRKGASLIEAPLPFRFQNKNTLLHDVALTELRMSLEKIGAGENWSSEQEIKRRSSFQPGSGFMSTNIPDAIFVANKNGENKVIALELELTPKGHLRYKNIFSNYMSRTSLSYVWYVVRDQKIMRLIFSMWEKIKKYPHSPELLVSLFADILHHPESAKLSDFFGETALIKEFFCSRDRAQVDHPLSSLESQNQMNRETKNPNQNDDLPSALSRKPQSLYVLDSSPSTFVTREESRPTTEERIKAEGRFESEVIIENEN